jgi:hypothetical protein
MLVLVLNSGPRRIPDRGRQVHLVIPSNAFCQPPFFLFNDILYSNHQVAAALETFAQPLSPVNARVFPMTFITFPSQEAEKSLPPSVRNGRVNPIHLFPRQLDCTSI